MTLADLTLRPVAESDIEMVEEWLRDAESRRYLGGMRPFRAYFAYQQAAPGYYIWIVYHLEKPVALTGFEIQDDGSAVIVLLVNPSQRRRGYGTCAVTALASVPEAQRVTTFVAPVEPYHQAIVRCLEAAGYRKTGSDSEDGDFIRYVLKRKAPQPTTATGAEDGPAEDGLRGKGKEAYGQ